MSTTDRFTDNTLTAARPTSRRPPPPPVRRTSASRSARRSLYGLQHILAMYAGVVSPPIIIASAAGLDTRATALLVTAALFVFGLGTLLQSVGVPYVGSQRCCSA